MDEEDYEDQNKQHTVQFDYSSYARHCQNCPICVMCTSTVAICWSPGTMTSSSQPASTVFPLLVALLLKSSFSFQIKRNVRGYTLSKWHVDRHFFLNGSYGDWREKKWDTAWMPSLHTQMIWSFFPTGVCMVHTCESFGMSRSALTRLRSSAHAFA